MAAELTAGDVIEVVGENEAVQVITVPEDGSAQRELLDEFLAKGRLRLVGDEPEEAPAKKAPARKAAAQKAEA